MDPQSPFYVLFQPLVAAKLTLLPMVMQWVKPLLARIAGRQTLVVTAVLTAVLGVGLAVWGGVEAQLPPLVIAGQAAIAFAWVQVTYMLVVEPVARSTSPVFPANPTTTAAPRPALLVVLVVALLALGAGVASAQDGVPILAVGKRVQATVQAGGMIFSDVGTETPNWRGVDLGGAVTYSLHQRLSAYGLYNHGFPLNSDGHRNAIRAALNLKVYPGPSAPSSPNAVAIGVGGMWLGEDSVHDWRGYEAHLVVSRKVAPAWALYGMYSHGFAEVDGKVDIDFGRVGLARRLWP